MRLAFLSPMIGPLSEPFPGGTEVVTAQLAEAFAARGHQVTVFASAGSLVPGTRVETFGVLPETLRWPAPPEQLSGAQMRELLAREQEVFHRIFLWLEQRADQFDLLHNHSFSGVPLLLAPSLSIPMLTTLHVPPILTELVTALRTLASVDRPAALTAVSHGLAREYQAITPIGQVIHNGVEVPTAPEDQIGDHLLFVGRISPEKGADLAIAAARAAGRRLVLVGRIEDREFYARAVAPSIDGQQVRYLGHLSREEVGVQMRRAAALLFTPRWPEPCSLAVLEGMSAGTPALAFAIGGLTEQIVDGRTGFLTPPGDIAALARAAGRLSEIRRPDCRAHVLQQFSVAAMLAAYETAYCRIAGA